MTESQQEPTAADQTGGVSRRAFISVVALGTAIVGASSFAGSAAPARAAASGAGSIDLSTTRFASVFVGENARFSVRSNGDAVHWRVVDLWGDIVSSGTARPSSRLTVPLGSGHFTLIADAYRGSTAIASARSRFAVLSPYRLPSDSAFGVNTHLQPPSMVPLLAALGTGWARTDLNWDVVEPAPLAAWTTQISQADATIDLDTTAAHSGSASVKIVNRTAHQDNAYATIAQALAVTPSTAYDISAWVKGVDARGLQFSLAADWGGRVDAPSGTFDWTKVAFRYTTGATETSLTLRLLATDLTASAWLDDVSVTAAGSSTNVVTNPGFETGLETGYTFATFDPYFDALAQHGVRPLPILDYANPKYDNGDTPYTDAGRAAFAAYTTAVMAHYSGRISAIEVYNEFNGGWFTTGPGDADPVYYEKLLEVTSRAIKTADPATRVVGGVTFGPAVDWLTKVIDAGGLPFMDVVSNHPYISAPESTGGIDQAEAQVAALVASRNNGTAKPVWITEIGWSLGNELTTAGYLVRGLVLGMAGGVQKFFWYDLVGDQNFGLLDQIGPGFAPRPVFAAYATAIRQLDAHTLRNGGVVTGTDIRRYAFTASERSDDVVVLWSTDAHEPAAVSGLGTVTLVDIVGSESTLTPLDGQIHLTLDGSPVYLRGRGLGSRVMPISRNRRVDVSATPLIRTSDESVPMTYTLDNTGSPAADLIFTTLGVPTRLKADRGATAHATAAIPSSRLTPGSNTVVTSVTSDGRQVGRLTTTVAVIDEPDGLVAGVGAVDWTDNGFALAPDGYASFATRFPHDVDFTAGVSDPAQAWPYIHPGPDDGWAGGRTHSFALEFTLASVPAAGLRAVVFLLDTHNTAPGAVEVRSNGGAPTTVALPAGGGTGYSEGSALTSGDRPTQFTVPLPASSLVAGTNRITIVKTSGSWMAYDSVGIYRA